MAPLDQFVLFGDSITEGFSKQASGFVVGAELQSAYIRRLDVINRGYSGYNTDNALEVIEKTIPTPEQATVRFLTIWFGANDANKNPIWKQYVPLDRFKQNLRDIIDHPRVQAHSPKIILLTPPPVEETMLLEIIPDEMESKVIPLAKDAVLYAQAVREVGTEKGVPVVDVWGAFMKQVGDVSDLVNNTSALPGSRELGRNEVLKEFLSDGLHLAAKGYQTVHEELMKVIIGTWPDQNPAKMPFANKIAWEVALGDTFWDIDRNVVDYGAV
ncbi:GDSL Lipase/Acylhydrolase family protein-like protein [Bisporella sp. PMI_857]|nr:GDSL Lipase/Acylhydrolase family protein-like protein [Bisporella sp. PMI_857]